MEMETYHGNIRTPADAIILFEACRQGLLPRVQRRLSEKERQSIRSGSVFVWDEREAGMRRWTDGKSWSASRVSGSFLTYREMEGKRGGGFPSSQKRGNSKDGNKDAGSDADMADDGPDGYRYKPDGLMKQSFSITTQSGQHLHLISYFARSHPEAQELKQPTQDPHLNKIRPPKGMYPESTVMEQNIPPVTRAPMASSPYTPSPQQMPTTSSPYNRPNGAHTGHPSPHTYCQPPGYTWPPPTPISTPPQPQHYSPYQQGTPMMYMHPSPGHPSPLHYGYAPYSAAPPHGPSGPTAFDRAPPPLAHTGLPPPPPHLANGFPPPVASSGGPQYVVHQSPRIPQATDIIHQQQQTPNQDSARPEALHTPNPIQATIPPTSHPHSHPHSHPSPRREPESAQDRPPPLPHSPPRGDKAESHAPGITHGGSDADTVNGHTSKIPSIHSLINSSTTEASDAKSDGSASRAGSKSPGSQRTAPGPNDTIGFGEDKRALRVLDRAMMRS
ncbi:MAG: hypothetical protein M1822_004194 [Bathelium mastoideum]|nr:MAG: hypothetical protein M1822_004194 [Bathelium mastoideum]